MGCDAFRDHTFHKGVITLELFTEHLAFLVCQSKKVEAVHGQLELQLGDPVEDHFMDAVHQGVHTLASFDGDEHGIRELMTQCTEMGLIGDEIDLVEGEHDPFVPCADFAKHIGGGFMEGGRTRMAGIDEMDEEIGKSGFLQRGTETLHQVVWQVADEADGVGEQQLLAVGHGHAARAGIQGGEQFVLGEHFAFGELIEQGRFAGVGVTDDRSVWDGNAAALFSLGFALSAYIGEVSLKLVDAFVGKTAVDLELGFTFTTSCAGAAATLTTLTVKVSPHAGQSGK